MDRRFSLPFDSAVFRLTAGVVPGVLTGLLTGWLLPDFGWAVAAVAGWDVAGGLVVAFAWSIIWTYDHTQTRERAAAEDPGRRLVSVIVILTSLATLFTASYVLRQAKTIAPHFPAFCTLVGLCIGAVVISWFLTHTAFTLRYAHLYYREDQNDGEGGLTFPGDEPPDDMDFAYFAFTIGMCFQTSDVTVTTRPMRRSVLGHSLLSFLYNTTILALSMNLVFGLFG